jgi:putative ABC transport system permease protein
MKGPSKLAAFLLKTVLPFHARESGPGDYREIFLRIARTEGRLKARLWFWSQIGKSTLPFLANSVYWRSVMLKNYLLTAFRNIKIQKLHFFINMTGLSVGIVCSIFIFLFIRDETTYDRFHENIDHIYYLYGLVDCGWATLGNPPVASVGPEIMEDYPEVVNAVRIEKEARILRKGDQSFKLTGLSSEPSFFQMFNFPLIYGDENRVLDDKHNMVLSAETALRLFNHANPLGETVSLKIGEEFVHFTIAGVAQPVPHNSSIQFDFLIHIACAHEEKLAGIGEPMPTFIELSNKDAVTLLLAKFPETIDKELSEQYKQFEGKGKYRLYPLANYHLDDSITSPVLTNQGNILYSCILSVITLLILIIACFNYTNLSMSGLSTRLKELSVRKVLGAHKREIARQFITESLIISVFAMGVGITLSHFLIPVFNSLVGKELNMNLLESGLQIAFLFTLALIVGCVTGAYTALIASRVTPVELFKKKLGLPGKNTFGRTLILIQFSISTFLIIGTLFMFKLNTFLLKKDLGYDSANIIRVDLENITNDMEINRSFYANYKNRIETYPEIRAVSGAAYSLSSSWMLLITLRKDNSKFYVHQNAVDYHYIDLLDIPLLDGRNFSEDHTTDRKNGVIVNESLVKELGIDNPIGAVMSDYLSEPYYEDKQIVGVVKDFHYCSLADKIGPVQLTLNQDQFYTYLYVKSFRSIRGTLEILEKEFGALAPHIPFEYSFLDDRIAMLYQKEKRWTNIITSASLFAILIACSGLFGLTMHIVTKRTKEIGIRKVLGASVADIARLINREFIGLIVLANLIAWPVVYYCLDKYMQNYAYRIHMDVWTFITAGLLTLLIASLTISFHAVRAAFKNPVEVIKVE